MKECIILIIGGLTGALTGMGLMELVAYITRRWLYKCSPIYGILIGMIGAITNFFIIIVITYILMKI